MKKLYQLMSVLVMLIFVANATAFAQSEATGTVSDAFGPVAGASVLVQGTTNGAITDIDGKFVIPGVKNGDVLEISFIGYVTSTVTWAGSPVEVMLQEDAILLEATVVTALGITREKKSLGYALQDVKGEELLATREVNVANALTGKVSGLQVIRSSNGPAGSSKIQLRGANSITGTNQPLIVVDGTPIDNFTGANNNDYWNPGTDMGNGLSDINAEDIESMSVLKGASAAALYGSRAGNGVILITTKKGAKNPGLGITISSSVSVEDIFMRPDRQTVYGQGSSGIFDAESSSNWGPKIEGQIYQDKDGNDFTYKYYDNVANFFSTGVNSNQNIAFSQKYDKTSVYVSATRLDDFSKIPGAEYNRTNITTRVNSGFGKNRLLSPGKDLFVLDGKVQYINSHAKNRPLSGQNDNNYFYAIYSLPNTLDITKYKTAVNKNDGTMYWWSKGSGLNPYWSKDYNTNVDDRNRFLMNFSLKVNITDCLSAEFLFGSDMYFTETESKLWTGSPQNNGKSRYSTGEQKFFENNASFLITAGKDRIAKGFGINATFGGNIMERKSTGVTTSASELITPNLFWITNSQAGNRSINQVYSHRKMNSLYGTLSLNWDGWIFLDGTFRNDWSSTLSAKNRSFFYPSVSVSWVISEMVNKIGKRMPDWFSYAKVRASFAQVGNDMDPYQLYNTYSIGSDGNAGNITASSNSTLYNDDVRSELISSWEVGLELRFFNNRLGFDLAWYKTNARRQLLNMPMNSLSGYSQYKINAGDIQNMGWELMVNATPVERKNFTWDTYINFSQNTNKILALEEGISEYQLGGYDNLKIIAKTGGNYGEIWGTAYRRVEDKSSPYYGKLLLNSSGVPQGTSDLRKLGDQQAICLLGWNNSFKIWDFSLSFLIDARIGGQMYSGTNKALQANGTAALTVVNGSRDEFVVDGVIEDGNNGYVVSDIKVTPQQYWSAVTSGNLGIGEANVYDATNVRLRNVSLTYAFPRRLLERQKVLQQVKLGFTCTNVAMIYSAMNGVDPESVFAVNTNAYGFENLSSPTSRTFLFNVILGF